MGELTGEMLFPPFVDIHTHFREPSPSNKAETFRNGTQAALESGILVTADMPNTPKHETWSEERVLEKASLIDLYARGFVMVHAGGQPESDNIGEFARMALFTAGFKGYGGKTTNNTREYEAEDFREGVAEWNRVAPNSPYIFHAGKENLEDMIHLVAGEFGHHLHVAHVNHPNQVRMVKRYKEMGLPVTCGITPHHLLMDTHDEITKGKFAEMMPRLAHQDDAEELIRMLANGDIDIIETDYAPHTKDAKLQAEIDEADCFGEPGIEHVAGQLFYQVHKGRLPLERLVDAFSTKPAKLLGITIDPKVLVSWNMDMHVVEERSVLSGAGWSPYVGNLAVGSVVDIPALTPKSKFLIRGAHITRA